MPQVDIDAIALRVRRDLRSDVTSAVKEALAGVSLYPGLRPSTELLQGEVVAYSPPPEPAPFIPSGIVKDGGKADITVESQESASSGVDAAAKALKDRRKTTKKPKKAAKPRTKKARTKKAE